MHSTLSNLHQDIEHHLASDGSECAAEGDEENGGLHVTQHQFKAQDVYRYPPPERTNLGAQKTRDSL